jgi:MYND finger
VDVDGNAETVRQTMANLSLLHNMMPAANLADRTPERCSHCRRGGMKLAGCSAFKISKDKYCSKQCQVASWKTHHKYVCKSSKNRLDAGTRVTIQGLETTPQHNGKSAIMVKFLPNSKRFVIQISADDENEGISLNVKPQNLSKMQQ